MGGGMTNGGYRDQIFLYESLVAIMYACLAVIFASCFNLIHNVEGLHV